MKNGVYKHSNSDRWYKNDVYHREDGPAIEWFNGDKSYYINGIRHREDGPAIEYAPDYTGKQEYYLNGEHIDVETNEQFLRIVKLKAFL